MKRLIIIVVACAVVMSANLAFAGGITSPAKMVKAGSFCVGLEGTWVSEQKEKDSTATGFINGAYSSGTLDDIKIKDDKYYLVSVAYGILDRLNIYAKAGMVDGGKLKIGMVDGGSSGEAKLKSNFAWAVGGKANLFESKEGLGVNLAAQYLRYDNRKIGEYKYGGATTTGLSTDDNANYWQADVAATLYWNIMTITPYVGVGYSYSELKCSGNWGYADTNATDSINLESTLKNKENVTTFVGLDWRVGKDFTLNIQGDFVSSTAATLGLTYDF
ncbi:MAG: autotransporter outer membrane beta-barrel domain-containing protein [Desulfarculus sp.]|nr:autotransporter outer membrane beta-barrel domain-containing protein [Desulfarculus sp.]